MDKMAQSETEIRVTTYGTLNSDRHADSGSRLQLASASVDPVEMSIATVGTVMMLLASKEECIVLQAARALEKFASLSSDNLEALSRLGVFDKMAPLISVAHLPTRRFVLKLLVRLLDVERVRTSLLRSPAVILQVFHHLAEDPDELIQEYASKILSELLDKPSVVDILNHETNYVEVFFQKLATLDPDIKANCLESLLHVLRTPAGYEAATTWPGFSFAPLIALLASRYERIQMLVLVIFELMTRHKEDEAAQERFRDSGAVEKLVDILIKLPWHDLHRKVLCTLANIADTERGALMLDQIEAVDELVKYMDNICRVENVECGFRIFMNLSKSEVGREIAVKHHVTEIIMRYLDYDNENIVESALQSLNNMCANKAARHIIGQHEPSPLMILENFLTKSSDSLDQGPTTTWTMRSLAAATLGSLAVAEHNVCQQMANFRMQEVFYDIMWTNEAPPSTLQAIVHIIEVLVGDKALRALIAEKEAINCLLYMIQGTKKLYTPGSSQEDVDREITLSALRSMCRLMAEPPVQQWFLDINGLEILHACLKNPTTSIREAGARLVEIMAPSEVMAQRFVVEGFIDTLLRQDAMRICCTDWENAICLIFGYNLPAKWFYTGRLGQQDRTRDNFYTSLRVEKEFLQLEMLLAKKLSPIRPIYVCRFGFNEEEVRHRIVCNMSPGSHLQTRVSPYGTFSSIVTRRSRASQLSFNGQNMAPGIHEKPLMSSSQTSQLSSNKLSKRIRSPHPSSLSLSKHNNKPRERSSARLRSKSKRGKKKVKSASRTSITENDLIASNASRSTSLAGEADQDLCHYLQHLRLQLSLTDKRFAGPTDPKDTVLSIQRAQIVAMFVVKQMVGTVPSDTCEGHMHEVHINELKRKLASNVLPLGHVKCGLHFERALLYKILSDRVHNPCELVRGKHRMAWIELYVHEMGVEDAGNPNCVIDLMDNVAALMRLHSYQAERYCYPDVADQ